MTGYAVDVVEGGVGERWFTTENEGEGVPSVLWTPEGAQGERPKVLFGHGGVQDKKAPNIEALARSLVAEHGYAAVCIDGPGCGDASPPSSELRCASDFWPQGATTRSARTGATWVGRTRESGTPRRHSTLRTRRFCDLLHPPPRISAVIPATARRFSQAAGDRIGTPA